MHGWPRPILRERAPQLMLYLLVSFGASVVLTRLFLALTGYPQVGGGPLHIAHLLWGGLLLIVAGVVLLLFASPSLHPLAAIGVGVGIGLFIDEVGKFITSNNNYSFRPAAPIIYGIFLVVAAIYLLVRRSSQRKHARRTLVALLEKTMQFAEGPQPASRRLEFDKLFVALGSADVDDDYRWLANALREFVQSENVIAAKTSGFQQARTRAEDTAEGFFTRHIRPITFVLVALLTLRGLVSLIEAGLLGVLEMSNVNVVAALVTQDQQPVGSFDVLGFALGMVDGMLLLFGCVLFIAGKRRAGLFWMQAALLLSLCVGGVFDFYSNQFSATVSMLADLLALLYLRWYSTQLARSHATPAPQQPGVLEPSH